MKHQKGAALIVVLSLLTVSLMVGLSSMQSSQIDERLAGNYRMVMQAHMVAETGLSVFHGAKDEMDFKEIIINKFKAAESGESLDVEGEWKNGVYGASHFNIEEVIKLDDTRFLVKSVGRSGSEDGVNNATRVAYSYYVVEEGKSDPVFVGPIACENLNFNSDFMDSYDSRIGGYGGENSKRSFANIGVISSEGSNVNVSRGGTKLYGNVLSRSSVNITGGGSKVIGDILANGSVNVSGSSEVTGSIVSKGDVLLGGSTTTGGSVQSDGNVIMEGWNAVVKGDVSSGGYLNTGEGGKVEGNARVEQSITTSGWGKRIFGFAQAENFISSGGGGLDIQVPDREQGDIEVEPVKELASQECDVLKLADNIEPLEGLESSGSLNVNNGAYVNISPASNGSKIKIHDKVSFMGESSSVVRLDSLDVGGGSTLEVSGGKDVILFVDGDVNVGGGSFLKITGKGTSLKIVTNGEFNQKLDSDGLVIDTETESGSNVVDDNNNPIFSLYTTDDVNISGAAKFYGSIYAPYSSVNVSAGGGFFGAMRAKELSVEGGDGIHFDEALLDSDVGGGTEGDGAALKLVSIVSD